DMPERIVGLLKSLPSLSTCSLLSLINIVGFFVAARFAESLGFSGRDAIGQFSLTVGLITMLVTTALTVWSVIDHFWGEASTEGAFTVALNLGFFCAFLVF